jgi:hypothetical protein
VVQWITRQGFEMDLSKLNPNNNSHVNSTIAKPLHYMLRCTVRCKWQLIYQRITTLLDAFQFIKDVAIDWTESNYPEADGQYITVARKAKGTNNWL